MFVRVHLTVDELAGSLAECRDDQDAADFFSSHAWLENFERNGLESDAEVRIYCVYDSPTSKVPRVIFPLRSPAGQNGSKLPARWVGSRSLAGLTNYQSTVYRFPITGDARNREESLAELARALHEEKPSWSVVDIDMLQGDDDLIRLLATALESAGWIVTVYDSTVTLFEPVRGLSYESYFASLPSILRNTLKRRRKKLLKKFRVRYEFFVDENDLETAIVDYERVLANSWKEPERFPDFTAGLIRSCARTGALRLGLLYLDETPAAVQFWIVSGGQATIYKLHYDEAFKDWSVGTLLTGYMMQQVLDGDEVTEIDFGRDYASYKRNWLSKQRPLCGVLAFHPRSVRGRALFARQLCLAMGRRAKGALRRLFDRRNRRQGPE